MFSGRYEFRGADNETQKAIFIDRDGERFRHILNYLRTGTVHLDSNPVKYQELLEEAQYFQLCGLENELEERLAMLEAKQSSREHTLPTLINSNNISTEAMDTIANTVAAVMVQLQKIVPEDKTFRTDIDF
ncbi:hypothetical protein CYMTET_33655 [Cymbomonas tetramitiformis]|uniref:Potassium channel tetramerisation-type BTB domain-containing protein n=1 Tax=Cymbomonas tetramitiformis TaxID=36881 RepID=A0AAE0FCR2_9CHLO|nr:hypothetical protein CYMTET_33655 [Cymbomonas tetramitiformis]